ncbi:DUF5955 family protein [Streptomyces barkulensis]|uniref:DUF5955 family protein n=1 Tax=Streptomyces barkulensis TaxID=1257026 RepID=UPI000C6EF0B0|nr:DUF5955 family protein [Streptomyces barkulensis]
MRKEAVGHRAVVHGQDDPRVIALRRAVSRLHRELAGYRAQLADRQIAEEELAAMEAALRAGAPEVGGLRHSLLLIAGAVGSVSALSGALAEVCKAVELFGAPTP